MKSYHLRHSASHNTSMWYFFIISLLLCRCSYENPIHKVRPGKTSELLASLRKSLRYYELNLSGVKQAKTQTKNKESVDEDEEDWISRKFYKAMDASVIAKDQEKRLRGSELNPDRAFETLFKRMGVTEKQLTPELDLRTTNVVPSISNQHKIYSKNNLLVEILKNGVVRGSVWKRQSNDKSKCNAILLSCFHPFHEVQNALPCIAQNKHLLGMETDVRGLYHNLLNKILHSRLGPSRPRLSSVLCRNL